MTILLDTSVYSQPIKKDPLPSVIRHWRAHSENEFAVSSICELEVRLGVLRSGSPRLETAYSEILYGRFPVLPFDEECAGRYAVVQAAAMAAGFTRPSFDLMIAVTALVNDLAIATCNPGDFTGIGDLTVLDWTV